MPFLDINIYVTCKELAVRTYQKPEHRYQYLNFFSDHTDNTKSGLVVGELIRYARTNTRLEDFIYISELFLCRLSRRGYPPHFINNARARVNFNMRSEHLTLRNRRLFTRDQRPIVALVLPYDRTFKRLIDEARVRDRVLQGIHGHDSKYGRLLKLPQLGINTDGDATYTIPGPFTNYRFIITYTPAASIGHTLINAKYTPTVYALTQTDSQPERP
jgi:hypothetical protein